MTTTGTRLGLKVELPTIEAVRAETFGKKKMYRYFGILSDGTEIVLRKSSTQLKPFAHFYRTDVASGANGVAAHFSYSVSSRDPKEWADRIAVFSVKPPSE